MSEQLNEEAPDEILDLSPDPELPNSPMLIMPILGPRYEVPKRIRNSSRSGVLHMKIHVNQQNLLIEAMINGSEGYRKEFSRDEITKIRTEWWRSEESCVVEEESYRGGRCYSCVEEAVDALRTLLKDIGTGEVQKFEVILEHAQRDIDFDLQKIEFLDRTDTLLQNRKLGRLLRVNEFVIEYDGLEEKEVLTFIPNLNFVGKKAVHFRRFHTDSLYKRHYIPRQIQLEMWAGLRKLTIEEPFWTGMSIKWWKQFTDVKMMRQELEEELLSEIVAIASATPNYSCTIRTVSVRTSLPVLQFVATLDALSATTFMDPSTGLQVDITDNVYTFTGPSVAAYVFPLVRIVLHPDHSSFRRTSRDRKSLEEVCTVKTFPDGPERVGCKTKRRELMMGSQTDGSLALPTYEMFAYHIDQCRNQLRNLDRFENMHEIENLEVSVAHAPDDERYCAAILKFLEKAKEVLRDREHRLKVHKFVMEYSDEGQVVELLPYLEMVGAMELHFRLASEEPNELVMGEVMKLRQWRQARKITMFGGWTDWSDDWGHLEKSRIVLERIDVGVVKKILEIARTSDNFVSCTIETLEPSQSPEVIEHIRCSFREKSPMEFEDEMNGIEVILSENLYIFKRNR